MRGQPGSANTTGIDSGNRLLPHPHSDSVILKGRAEGVDLALDVKPAPSTLCQ